MRTTLTVMLISSLLLAACGSGGGDSVEKQCESAMTLLCEYRWPGNVRELENTIERAVLLAEEELLLPEHFPSDFKTETEHFKVEEVFEGFSLKAARKSIERELIKKALKQRYLIVSA